MSLSTFQLNLTDTTKSLQEITESTEMPEINSSLKFIFVPLAVLITIMFLSLMVYLMARNRRKLASFYKRVHVPNFSFDDTSDLEDNEDPTECLLSGKLHIEHVKTVSHYDYDSYQIQTYNERRELYT